MKYEYKGNVAYTDKTKGLWDIYEDENGKSSLTEHKPKLIWQSCEDSDHFFELTDSPKRECTCNKCGFITTFIVGLQNLIDGKIVNLR